LVKILVIDDDGLMLEVMREILELDGYEVALADSGEDGVRQYLRDRHDVVITDLIMPHRDGVCVIESIKADNPLARVIAVSGTPQLDTIAAAVSANADRVIAKPFEQDELLDAIAEITKVPA